VAIPAMLLHRYFERHVDSLIVQLEGQSIKLVDAMHSDLFKQS
ncbi:MAG: MotA/TolQ/ExbB proton channel family protein, partial [Porticoccaceae bacterium]|nr:MotA/TolQ/ExbB proton channel family protein [Porticoccaceae bacterium]